MCDQCIKICGAITKLRATEGSSVTIIADNPDYIGSNSLIYCNANWTNWNDLAFRGDNLVDALEKAVEFKHRQSVSREF